jgi:hypothetical protein
MDEEISMRAKKVSEIMEIEESHCVSVTNFTRADGM